MDAHQAYKEKYRREIVPKHYNPTIHIRILVILVALGFAFTAAQIKSFSWMGVLVFFATVAYSNLHIYLVHRFLLHRRVWGYGWAFDMHVIHHQLYVNDKLEFEDPKDLYMLLMPPKIMILYYLVYCPLVLSIVRLFLPLELFWYSAMGFALWFGYYELVHYIEHMPLNHPVMKFSYCRFLRKFHQVHHDEKLRNKRHFDIAIPMYDYLFNTAEKLK